MKVPFLDLRAGYLELASEIDNAIARVLASGYYIFGEEVEDFEHQWADYCETQYAVGVGNGLDALYLALKAMNVSDKDEVIVPSNTYIATWLAVSRCGAKPVPVEPIEATSNIDPKCIEAAITNRTKVIIPVHLYGQPANLNPILELARRYGLFVLEDAAQAHGARYYGKRIGAHGDAVAWSFYPTKNLGAFGDAGAVTSDNKELIQKIRILSNYGSEKKYYNSIKGINSRLDPVQAAVLKVKLRYLDSWNKRRGRIANLYNVGLNCENIIKPAIQSNAESVWHQYVIRHEKRNYIIDLLEKHGIGTSIHYPIPPNQQKAYEKENIKNLPISLNLSSSILSLPISPHIDDDEIQYIIDILNKDV